MVDYVELHCHSYFSLLDGASSPEALIARAAELEMPALALTDHDAVYGALPFIRAAREAGIRPLLGAELTFADGAHLTLLVENATGWHNLCWLITQARHHAPKGSAALLPDLLPGHTAGLIALSGCRRGAVPAALLRDDWDDAVALAAGYRDLFGADGFWIELHHHLLPDDDRLVDGLVALAHHLDLGYVATNNVHYAARDAHRLQDVLVCIRHNTTVEASAHLRRPNSEYYLKPGARLAPLFAAYPEALANTRRIAARCEFEPAYGWQALPEFPTPRGLSATDYLRALCQGNEVLSGEMQRRLDYELSVIERAGLANYFLIVWDIVRFARQHGIRCQGRGSAANSLVAYRLGITPINPLDHDLVFERFLSDERRMTPDIDIDFDAARREEVIQYVYERYGPEHTGMACTLVTFRARSALRAVGKTLGMPPGVLDRAARLLDTRKPGEIAESVSFQNALGDRGATRPWQQVLDLCAQIDGFPRHLGIHNGGMVITGAPLATRVPTEPATMAGWVVVQWDKESLEDAGLVKIDLLGLRMLSALAEAETTVTARSGPPVALDALAFDDPVIYELIGRGDTIGVFQVESRAQTQLQPIFRPRCFADLIVAISLIRPGPIQGDMVHPYIRRRLGQEPVSYPHPDLKPALAETLGVILFQEQVLKVARDLAGLSAGQGELLRRALGAKRAGDQLDALAGMFVAGAVARGVPQSVAEAVFDSLRAFGGYSFPKSHAAAFAVLVYQSAWLKVYHPAAFYAALLNHQPMGFWSPAVLVNDARRHEVEVLPVDIARSEGRCTVEGANAIRLGLEYVRGLGEAGVERLVDARLERPFDGLADLCQRARLPASAVERLVLAGALDGWGIPRRRLLWELGKLRYPANALGLDFPADGVQLPALSPDEKLALEHGMLGLSTGAHIMESYRAWLAEHDVLSTADVKAAAQGVRVAAAGLVVVHQASPTAKGYHFVTLEDEFGLLDVVVRPPVVRQYTRVLRAARLLMVAGVVQRQVGAVNILAQGFRRFDAGK